MKGKVMFKPDTRSTSVRLRTFAVSLMGARVYRMALKRHLPVYGRSDRSFTALANLLQAGLLSGADGVRHQAAGKLVYFADSSLRHIGRADTMKEVLTLAFIHVGNQKPSDEPGKGQHSKVRDGAIQAVNILIERMQPISRPQDRQNHVEDVACYLYGYALRSAHPRLHDLAAPMKQAILQSPSLTVKHEANLVKAERGIPAARIALVAATA